MSLKHIPKIFIDKECIWLSGNKIRCVKILHNIPDLEIFLDSNRIKSYKIEISEYFQGVDNNKIKDQSYLMDCEIDPETVIKGLLHCVFKNKYLVRLYYIKWEIEFKEEINRNRT